MVQIIVDLFCYHQERTNCMTSSALSKDAFFPPHASTPPPSIPLVLQRKLLCAHVFHRLGTALEYLQQKERKGKKS